MNLFKRAALEHSRLNMAIMGGPGTGKTYTALRVAAHLGERICLIDAEHGRASLYAQEFSFDTAVLPNSHPKTYTQYLRAAETAGYDVIIVDGITPEWDGPNGCLNMVDEIQRRGVDKLRAWGQVTPIHDGFFKALIDCSTHLICTMRGRERYVVDKDVDGRSRVVKLGVGPIQQEKVLFDFAIIGSMDTAHNLEIVKTACHELNGALFHEPGEDLARVLLSWLESNGAASTPPAPLSESEVRATMGAAVRAGRWTMVQISALMRSLEAEAIENLSDQERRRVVNALKNTTGSDWAELVTPDVAK